MSDAEDHPRDSLQGHATGTGAEAGAADRWGSGDTIAQTSCPQMSPRPGPRPSGALACTPAPDNAKMARGGRTLRLSLTSLTPTSRPNHPPVASPPEESEKDCLLPQDRDGDAQCFWEPHAKYSYESLDYQTVENELLREDRRAQLRQKVGKVAAFFSDWQRWLLLLVIGALTGLTAFGIDVSITAITKKKWEWAGDALDHDSEGNIPFWTPYLLMSSVNLALVMVACLLVVYAEPLAAGSGIPEVKCFLNGVHVYRIARLKTLCAKGFGILFSVSSGLPCGKEGPMIHSGAVIGGGVSTGMSALRHFDTGFFKAYRGDKDRRLFVAAGAAAGVAAAFGAPVGGVLFAVEEACTWWSLSMSTQIFFCATVSSATLNLLKKWDEPEAPASGLTNFGRVMDEWTLGELPLFILLGVCGGLVGAAFVAINMWLTRQRKKFIRGIAWRRIAEVVAVNLLVSTTLAVLTTRVYNCEPISQFDQDYLNESISEGYIKTYGCKDKLEYNDMATYFFSQAERSIKELMHSDQRFAYTTLCAHFFPYFFLTVITYGIAVPSGLFLPSLALGAGMGRIVAQAVEDIFHVSGLHLGMYSCFGAAAVLGGNIRMTVSLSVIVMEASGNSTYIVPLMIISCIAKLVGDLFTLGIYDAHIQFNRVPLLEEHMEDPRMAELSAADVMNATTFPVLPEEPTAEEVLVALSGHEDHNGFVVTKSGGQKGALRGFIPRRWLMILIREGAYGDRCDALTTADFGKTARERELLKVETYAVLAVPTERLHDRLNLRRYMDTSPFTVPPHTPLPRVYAFFRSMGLRHLIVVDDAWRPQGVICRKNLVHLRRVEGEPELRIDPADGRPKSREDFGQPRAWCRAAPHAEAFNDGRHPSRQRSTNFVVRVGSDPAPPAQHDVNDEMERDDDTETDPRSPIHQSIESKKNELRAGYSYFTVGRRRSVRENTYVDPQQEHERDQPPRVRSRTPGPQYNSAWRFDCAEEGHAAQVAVSPVAKPGSHVVHIGPSASATGSGPLQ